MPDLTKSQPPESQLPIVPVMGGPEEDGEEQPAPVAPAPVKPKPVVVAPTAEANERYWTEDRLIRIGLWVLFVVFAVGVVVSMSRWEVMSHVPPLPWIVGLALVAGPAWRAYSDYAEEAKGRRIRQEQAKTQYGVKITEPTNRLKG